MIFVPRFCVRPLMGQKDRPSSFFSPFVLMMGLTALVGLLSFGSSARAQSNAKDDSQIEAYTIVATPDGSSLCRDATPQEVERMLNAPESGEKLRLINHLEDLQSLTSSEFPSVDDPSLPGLKIFLLATDRLNANAAAKAAFIKAAKNWEDVIKTPMTIYIRVDVGTDFFGDGHPYDSRTIGSTSSGLTSRSFSQVRSALISTASNANETALYNLLPNAGSLPTDSGNLTSIFVSYSIARALGFLPANASSTDTSSMPKIGFNSAFEFDYDQSNNIASGQTDFTAVATHEIGHALGFSSTSGDTDPPIFPAVLDLFRFRPGVTDFTNGQRIMTIGGGQQVFSAGGASVFTTGSEAGLSTGGPDGSTTNGGDGRQSSHWRDDTTALGGIHYGIMDPSIRSGVAEFITTNDLVAFNYLGYNLENSVGPPQPTPPANDNFASAQAISGCSGSVNGTNVGATKEAGEGVHFPGSTGGVSVWYQWIAPSTGSVTITTQGSSFDTTLGVYMGNSVSALQTIIESDDVNTQQGLLTSTVTFNAVGGTTYRIAVDGYLSGDTGSITLNWTEQNCSVAPPANPIDDPQFFVRQHYLDFLNREPDPQGLTGWVSILNNCPAGNTTCDRIEVSSGFFRSPEFRERGYFPYRFYAVSLGRKPNYAEFTPDMARVSGFLTEAEKEQARQAFIQEFMSRAEFTSIYNSLTNSAYVQRLFDTAGLTQITVNGSVQTVASMQQQMAGGKSRAQVLREIVESPEVDAKFYTQAFVVMQYFGYLKRDPDALYLNWITTMQTDPNNYRQMVNGFVNSLEYRARFAH